MLKKILITISYIILFTSCHATPPTSALPEDILSVGADGTLRIIIPVIYHRIERIYSQESGDILGNKLIYPDIETELSIVNRRLKNISHNMSIEIFIAPDETNIDYYGQYIEFIKQNIRENIVFILPNNDKFYNIFNISGIESSKIDIFLLLVELCEMLGDFYNTTDFFKNHSLVQTYNEPSKLVLIPTGHNSKPYPNVLSILVLEDIAKEYPLPINTASDFINLLDWIMENGLSPDGPPGMLPIPGIPGNSIFPSLPYELFYPKWDIMRLNPVIYTWILIQDLLFENIPI